jgi:ribulose-5-phosphate 4-epimerase/fuculose-1-phosphate aldolase
MDNDSAAAKLRDAAARLDAKGLLQPGDSLSLRVAGNGQILLLTATSDAPQIMTVALSPAAGRDRSTALAQHLAVYQVRPDVGCVLLNRQPWSAALHSLGQDMPGVFDEQIRHLGRKVALLDDLIGAPASRACLRSGANAFAMPGRVLCMGTIPERTVFNAELLEKCAKAYVLASSAGQPVGRIPWLVRWIANGRLQKDQKHAAAQYAKGLTPVLSTAY